MKVMQILDPRFGFDFIPNHDEAMSGVHCQVHEGGNTMPEDLGVLVGLSVSLGAV